MITTKATVAGVLLLGALATGSAFATTAAAAAEPLPTQGGTAVTVAAHQEPAGTQITAVPVDRELAVSPDGTRINFAVPGTREGVVSPDGTRINF
ncbi:hypothetical protein [Amycolatopsis saalfeldensis]|uniref:WD40-like Beta Propeller Repeat n=1 Tax=Amycolatopsis saalfeldensis TaxID=394193 RepID=A0A1H8YP56_9PSEU|nr:hypothetical protein [Amycolatopsis saalfeldensis]SEP53995.1 hypothetical protein SAMN04489732_13450 [Amycolatopsis saalfeldensis]